jgi:hypothetical protein
MAHGTPGAAVARPARAVVPPSTSRPIWYIVPCGPRLEECRTGLRRTLTDCCGPARFRRGRLQHHREAVVLDDLKDSHRRSTGKVVVPG